MVDGVSRSARSVAHVRTGDLAVEREAIAGDDARKLSAQLPLRRPRIGDDDCAARPWAPIRGRDVPRRHRRSVIARARRNRVGPAPVSNAGYSRISRRRCSRDRDFNDFRTVRFVCRIPSIHIIAHPAACGGKACEPMAEWLAPGLRSASRGAGFPRLPRTARHVAVTRRETTRAFDLRARAAIRGFIAMVRSRRVSAPSALRKRAGISEPVRLCVGNAGAPLFRISAPL